MTEMYLLTVLEAGSPKSRRRQRGLLLRAAREALSQAPPSSEVVVFFLCLHVVVPLCVP